MTGYMAWTDKVTMSYLLVLTAGLDDWEHGMEGLFIIYDIDGGTEDLQWGTIICLTKWGFFLGGGVAT